GRFCECSHTGRPWQEPGEVPFGRHRLQNLFGDLYDGSPHLLFRVLSAAFAHFWGTRRDPVWGTGNRFIVHIADLSAQIRINLRKWSWILRRGEGGGAVRGGPLWSPVGGDDTTCLVE